jgi:hypothetical protein
MNQKPTLESIVTVGALALLVISVLFLVNHWLGVPLVIDGAISLLMLTGVVAALVQSIRKL